ncbi:MAG TPA: hypothetical protein VMT56_01885 [Candidatus Bathyarchaeia archaeon]|nr:hypothetical protein [Candidatus Bathyarchaeia archaeon]
MSLPGALLRKIQSLGKLPFNETTKDRATWPEGEVLFQGDTANPREQWIFHPQYQDAAELTFSNGAMYFCVKAETVDEWAYIYLDPAKYDWDNYSWQMKFRRMTPFQEYAFNFRYVDFDNRYRYRFEDDLLFFDSKVRAKWRCHARMPFPMAMGAWYDLRIDTRGDRHRCYVNGMLMMENRHGAIRRGSISIILWEIDKLTDCVAEVGPATVRRLL